ncbi:MAG: hypothetical protein Tp165SUR256671_12 [Prokaryotic dsDNA virus sp.]|nr:MAG: hypothetical protein Tp165SUR256671_12 [Prokaryotic dsDNA virus sp.]|tara:strand:+ start:860 stop:1138 length:279 start_codon:yes stop_codon:yes gene_type:complete
MKTFETYDQENPQIWKAFVKLSFEAKNNRKFKNYSAKSLFEIIRWHTPVSAKDKFKINNNYAPDYARKMMEEYKQFKGFFRIRELKSKRHEK